MITTRPATAQDARLFFDWRNDKLVAAQSFNSDPIEFSQHETWFRAKLANPDARLYVFRYRGADAGQVRFDKQGNQAEISYSLDAEFRGKGLASALLKNAIERFGKDEPGVHHLIAKVKKDNVASNRVFEKLAFRLLPADSPDSDNTFELKLTIA